MLQMLGDNVAKTDLESVSVVTKIQSSNFKDPIGDTVGRCVLLYTHGHHFCCLGLTKPFFSSFHHLSGNVLFFHKAIQAFLF